MEENDESTVEKFIKIQIKQPREKQFSVLFVSRFVSGTQRGDKLTTSSERVDPGDRATSTYHAGVRDSLST